MPNVDESKELMGFLEAKRIYRIMLVSKANNPETKSCKGHFSCTEHSPIQHSSLCWLHYICSVLSDTPHWRLLVVSSANSLVFHGSDVASMVHSHLHQLLNCHQTCITAFHVQCRRQNCQLSFKIFYFKRLRVQKHQEKIPAEDCTSEYHTVTN